MPRLNADQWAAVRIEWEGEPAATFSGLADKHGVNKSEISRHAGKEGWAKRGQLQSINEAAQRKADSRVDAEGNATPQRRKKDAPRTGADGHLNERRRPGSEGLASRDDSEDKRAEVLVRHRREWAELEGFRKTALMAMKAAHESKGDEEAWKTAKAAAATASANLRSLAVKQDGERRAWGLEEKQEAGIVISNPRHA